MEEIEWEICCECGDDHAALGHALCTDCLEGLGEDADAVDAHHLAQRTT